MVEDERIAAKKEIRKVFGQLTPEGRRMVAECLEEVERTKGRGAPRSDGLLEAVHDGRRILSGLKAGWRSLVSWWKISKHERREKRRMRIMIDPVVQERISIDLEALTLDEQRRAADLVHSFRLTGDVLPPPVLGKDLLHLAGTVDDASARQMMEAIQECKQVDPRDW